MKLKKSLFIQTLSTKQIITNIDIPSCRNCIYFTPSIGSYSYATATGKCFKFGNKNIISGQINYDYANLHRTDNKKCDNEGKYFIKDKNINTNLKIFKSIFLHNLPSILFTFSIGSYCIYFIL